MLLRSGNLTADYNLTTAWKVALRRGVWGPGGQQAHCSGATQAPRYQLLALPPRLMCCRTAPRERGPSLGFGHPQLLGHPPRRSRPALSAP